MRNVLIALLSSICLMTLSGPAGAVQISQAQFDTVCGKNQGIGVDDQNRPYEYCDVKCGLNGERVCHFVCVNGRCEGTVLLTAEGGDTPKRPKHFNDVMGNPGSLSSASESSGAPMAAPTIY